MCPVTDVVAADLVGAADVGAGVAAADVGAGVAAADLGAGAAAGLGAADLAGGAAAGLGAADLAGASTAVLPEITVSAPAIAGAAGGGSSALLPAAAGVAGGLAAGGGGGGTTSPTSSPQSTAMATPDTGTSMLAATAPSDIQGLDPGVAQMLGVDSGGGSVGGAAGASDAGTVFDPAITGEDPQMMEALTTSGGDTTLAPTDSQALTSWFKNPKNLATAGLLGISGLNALSGPKLPGAAKTALGAAGPAVQQATSTIQTGGQGSPLWPGQKAAIDASIDQQIAQQTEALKQAAANAGEQGPGAPTGVVAQQIASMTSQLNVQREQMYQQALNQIVQQAVQELTGGNQTLAAIANMQLAQDQEARQAAAETAQLAIELQSLVPG